MSILVKYIEDKKSDREKILEILDKPNGYICSKTKDFGGNVRKIISKLNLEDGMFIERLPCDLCDHKNKHGMYWKEWAMDYREVKEKINGIL